MGSENGRCYHWNRYFYFLIFLMKIALWYDHAGYEVAYDIRSYLTSLGYDVQDMWPHILDPLDDFPDYAELVSQAVLAEEAERGVLICGTGIGMSIAANRHPWIRAVVAYSPEIARISRSHNDANILCFWSRTMDHRIFHEALDLFLSTDFLGGKYERRNEMMDKR